MLTRKALLVLFICLLSVSAFGQNTYIETYSNINDDLSVAQWMMRYEILQEIADHPININQTHQEELEQLPFLTDGMIKNILEHIDTYGPMLSINELTGVKGMDYYTRKLLEEFVYVGEPERSRNKISIRDIAQRNKEELFVRFDFPLNQKAGYANYPKEEIDKYRGKKYLGSPFYHNFRYRFNYQNKILWGMTGEKDAGEAFFTDYNKKGYDSYSGYFMIQNMGRIKALVLGNFKASFGYGLVMNMDFSMGKYYSVATMHRMGRGLNKYSSVSEGRRLRGAGLTYKLGKRWNLSWFYSFTNEDARVDSLFIKSFKTDGYHRTLLDLDKRNKSSNQLIGCNLDYNGKYVEFGLTGVYNKFNKVLNPDYKPYNAYYPRGRDFFNAGAYYKFFLNRFILFGETAVDKKGSIATFNSCSYSPNVNTTFLFINRYYSKKYQTIYANGFGENSKTQNELGFYLGLETNILRNLKLTCYADYYYFPWYRYRVDQQKTHGEEGVVQLSYSPINSLSMLIKYGIKDKAQNYTSAGETKYVLSYIRHRLHYQLHYTLNEQTQFKTNIEGIKAGYSGAESSLGFLIGETVKFGFPRFPLQTQISGAWFHTHDYASRVYMYEPGLLYSFAMSSFYGKGFRSSVNLKYEFKKWLLVQCKMGWTHYTDRDKIGSGTEEITGCNKVDIQVQARVKF